MLVGQLVLLQEKDQVGDWNDVCFLKCTASSMGWPSVWDFSNGKYCLILLQSWEPFPGACQAEKLSEDAAIFLAPLL